MTMKTADFFPLARALFSSSVRASQISRRVRASTPPRAPRVRSRVLPSPPSPGRLAMRSSHQLVTHDGALGAEAFERYLAGVGAGEWNRAYQVVAIMGPQSSGKSTLMNHVFGTSFQEMNHELGRSQTTKGVWVAMGTPANASSGSGSSSGSFPTLVMDLEGTDGRERGEADAAFEKQTALFAMAVADVLLVNMWCQDIGREVASGKPLLKTIFQVNLKVFNPRRTTLCFVIRDKSRTPMDRLVANLREDLERIWSEIAKPPERQSAPFSDFFDLRFVALAHYEHAHEQFLEGCAELGERFFADPSANAGRAPSDGSGDPFSLRADDAVEDASKVPSSGLAVSAREAWRLVREDKDLNLPAHGVMVATVRCEEIAANQIARTRADQQLVDLAKRAADEAQAPLVGLRATLEAAQGSALARYDEESRFFDAAVVRAKRRRLKSGVVKALAAPLAKAHLAKTAKRVVKRSAEALRGSGNSSSAAAEKGKNDGIEPFAEIARRVEGDAREQWDAALADAIPDDDDVGDDVGLEGIGLGPDDVDVSVDASDDALTWRAIAREATDAFESALFAAIARERVDRVAKITRDVERRCERAVGSSVAGVLDEAPVDAWDRVNDIVRTHARKHADALRDALRGFELEPAEIGDAAEGVILRCVEIADQKTRDAALHATEAMKLAFGRAFGKDSQGVPRAWRADSDVGAANRKAQRAAVRVLGVLAVSRLEDAARFVENAPSEEEEAKAARVARDAALSAAIDDALRTFVPEPPSGRDADASGAASAEDRFEGSEEKSAEASTAYPASWSDGASDVAPERVLLDPGECRAAFRRFESETAYAVAQAVAARDAAARGGGNQAPIWMYVALFVTGFDEAMYLLRSPVTLLALISLAMFMRALYNNLDVEAAMRMGLVPGLMFLATKVVPTALAILKRLADGAMEEVAHEGGGGGGGGGREAPTSREDGADDRRAGETRARERVYAPSVSGEGVQQRRSTKPAAMMYPGGGDEAR